MIINKQAVFVIYNVKRVICLLKSGDNDEFEPDSDIDDDETTIAEEEENSHSVCIYLYV